MADNFQIEIPQYLLSNQNSHIDMIEILRMKSSEVVYECLDGVLIYNSLANLYLLSVKSGNALQQLIGKIHNPTLVVAHQEFAAIKLMEVFKLKQFLCCQQALWTHELPPSLENISLNIKPLTLQHVEDVVNLYSHNIGTEYIENRIRAKKLFGGYLRNELVGIVGIHEEGSIGMLEIVPSHRGNGYASQLLLWLCAKIKSQGCIPYSQITVNNDASRRLHQKLGFFLTDDYVYWLEKEKT